MENNVSDIHVSTVRSDASVFTAVGLCGRLFHSTVFSTTRYQYKITERAVHTTCYVMGTVSYINPGQEVDCPQCLLQVTNKIKTRQFKINCGSLEP